MIVGLDHIALTVGEVWVAAADLERVLGRKSGPSQPPVLARLRLDNTALHLFGSSAVTGTTEGPSPVRLVFATDDIDKAAYRLARRGLAGDLRQEAFSIFDLDVSRTHGMPISLSVNYASTGVACGHETPQTLMVKDGKALLPFTVSDQLPPGTYNICVCLAWRSDIRIGMPGPCTPLFPLKVLPAGK